ncbi:hypothetical protein ACP70R_004113 [Stipagrostis hirtigluma subsp. patula]
MMLLLPTTSSQRSVSSVNASCFSNKATASSSASPLLLVLTFSTTFLPISRSLSWIIPEAPKFQHLGTADSEEAVDVIWNPVIKGLLLRLVIGASVTQLLQSLSRGNGAATAFGDKQLLMTGIKWSYQKIQSLAKVEHSASSEDGIKKIATDSSSSFSERHIYILKVSPGNQHRCHTTIVAALVFWRL